MSESAYQPRLVTDFTVEEKCAAFDKLHAMAMEEWEHICKERKGSKDIDNWMFEAVMTLLASGNKADFWNAYNKENIG